MRCVNYQKLNRTRPLKSKNVTSHQTPIRVRYAETDQMGVVYHANYFVWMEVGRVEFCRAAGFNYKDLEAEGIYLAVAETHCRHMSPARYDDEIVIVTTIRERNSRMLTFAYEILRATERLPPAGRNTSSSIATSARYACPLPIPTTLPGRACLALFM